MVVQIASALCGGAIGILLGIPLLIALKEQDKDVKEHEESVSKMKKFFYGE